MGGPGQSEELRASFRILDHWNTNPFTSLVAPVCFCNFEFQPVGTFPMELRLDGGIDVGIPMRLSRAVPKRKAEFAAGRFCAQNAISKLTAGIREISSGESGEPIWPSGFIGSITHTTKRAAAIVCRSDGPFWVGIDLEEIISLDDTEEIGSLILTPYEKKTYGRLLNSSQILTTIFSAKESIYKAIFPKLRRFVDFQEVECRQISDKFMQFRTVGQLCNELEGRGEIYVQYRQLSHGVLTLCALDESCDIMANGSTF